MTDAVVEQLVEWLCQLDLELELAKNQAAMFQAIANAVGEKG